MRIDPKIMLALLQPWKNASGHLKHPYKLLSIGAN